jgi:hypothetical protein
MQYFMEYMYLMRFYIWNHVTLAFLRNSRTRFRINQCISGSREDGRWSMIFHYNNTRLHPARCINAYWGKSNNKNSTLSLLIRFGYFWLSSLQKTQSHFESIFIYGQGSISSLWDDGLEQHISARVWAGLWGMIYDQFVCTDMITSLLRSETKNNRIGTTVNCSLIHNWFQIVSLYPLWVKGWRNQLTMTAFFHIRWRRCYRVIW